jgi:hypothetical protein
MYRVSQTQAKKWGKCVFGTNNGEKLTAAFSSAVADAASAGAPPSAVLLPLHPILKKKNVPLA